MHSEVLADLILAAGAVAGTSYASLDTCNCAHGGVRRRKTAAITISAVICRLEECVAIIMCASFVRLLNKR